MTVPNDDAGTGGEDGHQPESDEGAPHLSKEERAKAELRDHVYEFALAAAIMLLATATVVYRIAEDWSWVDSFYFSAIAVTTVGFGDLAPTTDCTKLFTVFYIFTGISLLAGVLNERMRRHAIAVGRRRTSRVED